MQALRRGSLYTGLLLVMLTGAGMTLCAQPPAHPAGSDTSGAYLPSALAAVSGRSLPVTQNGAQVTHSVKEFGAKGDGTTNDGPAIRNALAATSGGILIFPAGTYLIDNSAANGVDISNWSGTIEGSQGTLLKCNSLENMCVQFTSPSNININNIAMTNMAASAKCDPSKTNCGSYRGTSPHAYLLRITGGTNVHLSHLKLSYGLVALAVAASTHVFLSDSSLGYSWGNNGFFTNDVDFHGTNLNSYYGQDAGYEFSTYGDGSLAVNNATLTNVSSSGDFSCILVNAATNVTVNGFTCENTWMGGVTVIQDPRTTKTHFPDNVVISNGVLNNIGAASGHPATAIQIGPNGTAGRPVGSQHIQLSNLTINGTLGSADAVKAEQDTAYDLTLSNVKAANIGNVCFRLGSAYIHASHLTCETSGSDGLVNMASSEAVYSDIVIRNASHDDVWNPAKGNATFTNITITHTAPGVHGSINDAATGGTARYEGVKFINPDNSTPRVKTSWSKTSFSNLSLNGKSISGR
jgi:hypothetical protein